MLAALKIHNFGLAWSILEGTKSSFTHASWVTLPLSILGYAFVPSIIGIVVGTVVQRMVRSSLTSTTVVKGEIAAEGATAIEEGNGQNAPL